MTESFSEMFEQSLANQRIRPGMILMGLLLLMMPVAAALSIAGESLAVQRDMDGYAWPPEGWAAVALAAVGSAYGIYSAHRVAAQERANKSS